MSRVHAFEFEDQSWLPEPVRAGITDFLHFMGNLSSAPYGEFVRRLAKAMRRSGDNRIVDLCSGSAGPIPKLLQLLEQEQNLKAQATLTDLYPNRPALERAIQKMPGRIEAFEGPVNAAAVPNNLKGFRILCNGFHHFAPEKAKEILADAVKAKQGIALIEGIERTPASILTCAMSVITVMVMTPFIRPFRWDKLALTYLLPLIPLATAWDGVVSSLRVYSPKELSGLVDSLGADNYEWDIGRIKLAGWPLGFTYLVGHPKN